MVPKSGGNLRHTGENMSIPFSILLVFWGEFSPQNALKHPANDHLLLDYFTYMSVTLRFYDSHFLQILCFRIPGPRLLLHRDTERTTVSPATDARGYSWPLPLPLLIVYNVISVWSQLYNSTANPNVRCIVFHLPSFPRTRFYWGKIHITWNWPS